LFSDTTLRPFPDDIWYELANYHLPHLSDPKKELLRQNAPYPHLASTQAVNFFYQKVGGQPPKAPSKSKLEAFSEKVNPAPQQGIVMRSAQLKQEDPAAAQQPALPVRQVAPAAADNQAERELQAMREAFRQLQAASEKDRAEKERLQRELEQEKQAKPAAAHAKPAAQAQPAQNEKYLCSICMDREFTVFYDPCGHKICKPCVDDWKKQKNGELNCPNCRQTAAKVTNLFD
ncbi:MAG: hypothetical protein LLG04_12620, partial [Parachlamydia sp.]|nr:hypothetical protein [Parachlamydia sp.]